jgi:hypothetical protein
VPGIVAASVASVASATSGHVERKLAKVRAVIILFIIAVFRKGYRCWKSWGREGAGRLTSGRNGNPANGWVSTMYSEPPAQR